MTKAKYLIITIFTMVMLFLIPSISNAATEYTYSDTKQGIEWSYKLDSSNNVINLRCKTTSKIGSVTIPSTIDGKTVISLSGSYDTGAFQNCPGITNVTIPNTISIIGSHAFQNCTGLKSITIPDSVIGIRGYAFEGCSGITTVTLSNNLTSIDNNAFNGCSGLKSLTIPNSVTTIGECAFRNCSGLKSLTLSKNLSKLSRESFEGCKGLTSVVLPDSVTTIEGTGIAVYGAFDNCVNLTKLLIPDSVASIGSNAFRGCKKLTIYGNDGSAAKEYAESNGISFDYIANWDKKSSGTDITAPTVKSIVIPYKSVMNYSRDANKNMYIIPTGAKLVINVNFNENIEGTTVPTLTIKFGDGQNIKVTEGTIGGSTITYIYTIKNTDKGIMTIVNLSGGNIKDIAGNAATLSCPTLSIELSSGAFIYANGTATNPDSGNNNQTTTGNNNNNNNNNNGSSTNGNKNNSNNTPNGKTDNTKATGKLPQTGIGVGIIAVIVITALGGTYAFIRTNKLRDI